MASFQSTVLVIALVILIVSLLYIAYSIDKNQSENPWPPLIGACPDYWVAANKADLSDLGVSSASLGAGPFCVNVKNLGKCSPKAGDKHLIMDFTTGTYKGSTGDCQKNKWATKCGVSWDGITYGVKNPCDKNPSAPATKGSVFGFFK